MTKNVIKINRREFLKWTAMAAAGLSVSANIGCESGGDDDDDSGDSGSTVTDLSGSIGSNHGHSVTMTAAQQTAGAAVTLTLSSGNGHTHSVSFTAEEVQTIAAGGTASSGSSTDGGHDHSVSFG